MRGVRPHSLTIGNGIRLLPMKNGSPCCGMANDFARLKTLNGWRGRPSHGLTCQRRAAARLPEGTLTASSFSAASISKRVGQEILGIVRSPRRDRRQAGGDELRVRERGLVDQSVLVPTQRELHQR